MPIFVPGLRKQPNRPGGFRGPKTKRVMTTIETANRTKTTYFVEYICDDLNNTYWQLVRSRDAAILAAHKDLNDIYADCFICGINKQDVTIW